MHRRAASKDSPARSRWREHEHDPARPGLTVETTIVSAFSSAFGPAAWAWVEPGWPAVWRVLADGRVIGWMEVRMGPNRVGPLGLLQPFADVFKMLFKEVIIPTGADKRLFYLAPIATLAPALAACA